MALGPRIDFRGRSVGIAAEHFCTSADLYRLLGILVTDQYPTADGQGIAQQDCARRLARMIGRDLEDAPLSAWRDLAAAFVERQLTLIRLAADMVLDATPLPAHAPVIGAGQGAFNAKALADRLGRPYRPISDFLRLTDRARDLAETAVTAIAVAMLEGQ